MARVLVCGDRNWTSYVAVHSILGIYDEGTVIIHGDCRGADKMAGEVATEYGFEVEAYPALWNKYGPAAGPIRNQQMLDEGKPDSVLVFHADLGSSKGSRDMVKRALAAGIEVMHYDGSEFRRIYDI